MVSFEKKSVKACEIERKKERKVCSEFEKKEKNI